VQRRDVVEDVLLLTGEVRAARSIDLSAPQVPGYQPRIHYLAEDGSEVKAGEVVVGFDLGTWVSQLDDKRLALVEAEAALLSLEQAGPPERAQHEAALERARVELRKAEIDAAVPPDVQARQDWQDKQNALRRAEAEHAKARLQLETWERTRRAELEKARIQAEKAERGLALVREGIQRTELRAPEDGLVIVRPHWNNREGRPFQVGDTVWVGLAVVSLPALASLEVAALLPEVDLGRVSVGQAVRCVPDSFPGRVLSGEVRAVGEASVEEASRSGYPVRIALDERPDWLRPGMSVRAEVVRQRWERALTVPRGAVSQDGDGESLVRLADGRRVPVELEACLATECLVASGLEEGAHVAFR
jgi:multidrug resistance efflux pump